MVAGYTCPMIRSALDLRRGRVRCAGLLAVMLAGCSAPDWRNASPVPVGLAPDPARTPEAVVQVYGARTVGWKGAFGVHTWIAVKPAGAPVYTVHEVMGWRLRWAESVVVRRVRDPDARWFGAEPELYAEKRGPAAEALIPRIEQAVASYPYPGEYTVWPGPNSNTFIAWVLRQVPELEAHLPATAIGKDYLGAQVLGTAPSGSGVQLSIAGLLGFTASRVEGLELNLLGLSFGIDPFRPALKLPLVGRLGMGPMPAGSATTAPGL
jgi:hypothetical protein